MKIHFVLSYNVKAYSIHDKPLRTHFFMPGRFCSHGVGFGEVPLLAMPSNRMDVIYSTTNDGRLDSMAFLLWTGYSFTRD